MSYVSLEEISKETLQVAREIVNSNKRYNMLENGREERTLREMEEEFLNPMTKSFLVKINNEYVGVLDYLPENPRDRYPWLGLLMIHHNHQGKGYGKNAYALFEHEARKAGMQIVRLAVLTENRSAKVFWESQGYRRYETKPYKEGKKVDCYEKVIKEKTDPE
ncbi:GNAT family N-acetyltransferase [Metabacillus schmidteae]|uniref:GNAT family N-acetyltransferase n=1 Tax=Metabacillus schmidteae TaxID=2730405 RepID=UPI00158E549B|nr:GNAT family N-acetyltransferase [Metabacillus schmidteae]